jgi:septum formation protein
MTRQLLLASSSEIRLNLLRSAGLDVIAHPARIDEEAIRDSLTSEGATPRDIADALAEMKAAKLAAKHPQGLVLGCDQTLDLDGTCLGKAETPEAARDQLCLLSGKEHKLHSALVIFDHGKPVWRHLGTARLTMRDFTDEYLDAYLSRNWPQVSYCVGGYMIEAEGIRLFSAISGEYHTILGLPLLPLLSWLTLRGFIPS